jgi:hypothetical protein
MAKQELTDLVKQYKTFDELLESGDFARLDQDTMQSVYEHYSKPINQQNNVNSPAKIDPRFADRSLKGNDDSLDYTLAQTFADEEDNLAEDRSIIQPDGSRACLLWELSRKGYHVVRE